MLINRDVSWLAFNHRVLQEAKDPRVPLVERLRYLAIYSSNLDEFFRVRVASLNSLLNLKNRTQQKLGVNPAKLVRRIHRIVREQQDEFGSIFRASILPGLSEHGIRIVTDLSPEQQQFARIYFRENIHSHLQVLVIQDDHIPFLKNRAIYLAVRLRQQPESNGADQPSQKEPEYRYAIVEIPSHHVSRFVELPAPDGEHHLAFLDEIIRISLPDLFPGYQVVSSYSVKLTRDAELYIDDEFSGDLVEKIRKGLRKRNTGVPSRFLYDLAMPESFLNDLSRILALRREDLIPGGRYHNFNDFFSFPTFGVPGLEYPPLPPLPHPDFDNSPSMFDVISERDRMLHFPYHSYEYVLRFLREAASDESVISIDITLYRVASSSGVIEALIEAARRGKAVTAFVEVKARFDEESNIRWAGELEEAGVNVLYSFPGLKVHAKLCLVCRSEGDSNRVYAYMATGNFNEKTARVYADHGLFTADPRLTGDAERVFVYLAGVKQSEQYEHLLVAPFSMRQRFMELIDNEMEQARAGKPASIIIKMNSLEDPGMIEKLYQAAEVGVAITAIIRGICCLLPGTGGSGRRIRVISIVDRYLEHARVFIFHNSGDERFYIASADWMTRNLSRRVEVAIPIYDSELQKQVRGIIALQLADTEKARVVDRRGRNRYRKGKRHGGASQLATYRMIQNGVQEPSEKIAEPVTGEQPSLA